MTLRLGTSNRRLDEAAISQGVDKECPFRPGLVVTILPGASYNPRFRKAIQNAALKSNGDAESAKEKFLSRYDDPEFVVEALVSDMKGLYNENGNEVKYTTERGLAIFSDPANADVKEWVVTQAHQYGQFYTESVEEDAGN